MTRRLVVEADGGSRGNPGVAGFGALVRDAESGALLVERAEPLGTASNNVAEYSGLVAGLVAAAEIDPGGDVVVRMDSKLVVEQMSGRWKIKHHDMVRLAAEAREVAADIGAAGGSVVYEWIPRARNKDADALSNEGMDGHRVTRRHPDVAAGERAGTHSRPAAGPAVPGVPVAASDDAAPTGPLPGWRERLGSTAASGPGRMPGRGTFVTADRSVTRHDPLSPVSARPSTPARVVLVRHGATGNTSAGRLDGRGGTDPGLDAQGLREARAAADAVAAFVGRSEGSGAVRVVSSTLRRAIETGGLVAAGLGVSCRADEAWDEQDLGEWNDVPLARLSERYGESLVGMRSDPEFAPPGGESHAGLRSRVVKAFEAQAALGEAVAVVTHRGAVMAVLEHVLGLDHVATWRVALTPGSLTSIRVWPDGGVAVEFVNDTSHLR